MKQKNINANNTIFVLPSFEGPDATDIEDSLLYLEELPSEAARIRENARNTAAYFTWQRVVQLFLRKLEFQANLQDLIELDDTNETSLTLPAIQIPV
jgi:glycosyltransferase involved in cell wall biosynthesis